MNRRFRIAGVEMLSSESIAARLEAYQASLEPAARMGIEPEADVPSMVEPVYEDESGQQYLMRSTPAGPVMLPFQHGSYGHSGTEDLDRGGYMPLWDLRQPGDPGPVSGDGAGKAERRESGVSFGDQLVSFAQSQLQGFGQQMATGFIDSALGGSGGMRSLQSIVEGGCFGGDTSAAFLSQTGMSLASKGLDMAAGMLMNLWEVDDESSAEEQIAKSLVQSQVVPMVEQQVQRMLADSLGMGAGADPLSGAAIREFFGGDVSPAGFAAARVGDWSTHKGKLVRALGSVLVNALPPIRLRDEHVCEEPSDNPSSVIGFFPFLMMEDIQASAVESPVSCQCKIKLGSPNVFYSGTQAVAAPPRSEQAAKEARAAEEQKRQEQDRKKKREEERKKRQEEEDRKREAKSNAAEPSKATKPGAATATGELAGGTAAADPEKSEKLRKLEEALRLSILAKDSYRKEPADGLNRLSSNASSLPDNLRNFPFHGDSSGFAADIYEDENGRITLVFRGTEDWPDWTNANLPQGAFLPSRQYALAADLARQVQSAYPERDITITGHSLGGGLAVLASSVTGFPAVTFNAAGVRDITFDRHGSLAPTNVTNYSILGDPLSSLQYSSVAIGMMPPFFRPMPGASGTQEIFVARDPDGSVFFSFNPINYHSIDRFPDTFTYAIEQENQRGSLDPVDDVGVILWPSSTSSGGIAKPWKVPPAQ